MSGLTGVVQSGRVQLQGGKFRNRVQIVQPSRTQDSMGGWNTRVNFLVLQCWATIEALSAVEKFAAHEFAADVTHKVWMRHPRTYLDPSGNTSGITAAMQVLYSTRTFQVKGVLNPVERPDALLLMCGELDDSVNQGAGTIGPPGTPVPRLPTAYAFTLDGTTGTIVLNALALNGVMVFWNSLFAIPEVDYTFSGQTVTLLRSPMPGDNVTVLVL